MEVGKLYRLKSNEKERLLERQERYARWAVPIGIVVILNNGRDTFPVDTLIVPLEIHSATKNCKRLKVLLSTGDVGMMLLSTDEWEEATV